MRIIPTGRPGATGPAGPTGPNGFGTPAYGEEIISGNAVATALPVQNVFVRQTRYFGLYRCGIRYSCPQRSILAPGQWFIRGWPGGLG